MKPIILVLLSAGFAFFGLSVDAVYAEIAGLVAATMTLSEAFNQWQDWHKVKAVLSTAGIAILLNLIGWQLVESSFIYQVEFMEFLQNVVLVLLGALGLWPQYKKAVDTK